MLHVWLLGVVTATALAADQPEKQPPYELPMPTGWRKESFTLPPTFAPDMKWKGKEELRFAPGMFKAGTPDFFSYAFLFWLSDDVQIGADTLQRELLAYYRGLARAVSKSKKREVDTKGFSVAITPGKPDRRPDGQAVAGYIGELSWIEPFATFKPQTLHLEIQSWPSPSRGHRCVFICASPQPQTGSVWKTLRDIRAGCTCR